jgi:hypothetical protein
VSKRTKARDGWGWETELDLFNELEKALGYNGDLSYSRKRLAGGTVHVYEWRMTVRSRGYGLASEVTQEQLHSTPVREIAKRISMYMRQHLESTCRREGLLR